MDTYRNSLKVHMNIYPVSTHSYSLYNVYMDHVGNLYHQRNGFYLEKRIEQLPLSGQVHLPNADRYHICQWKEHHQKKKGRYLVIKPSFRI